ncbi:hypothetical protein [Aliikangiella sp. G2MR2-5]|uniref:hypothetical protein n=1 Tax=Aliikangiella sp. G2MR2-5 TaxID=2788943 RepID=UPI0018ABEC9B|nr:hypothetical protein [Aliikangiella sp. G2MR2-5]
MQLFRLFLMLLSFPAYSATYKIPFDYGDNNVAYIKLEANTHLWQPCDCQGQALTLKDMGVETLLKALNAENTNIPDVSLHATLQHSPQEIQAPLLIVPGGYVSSAFPVTAEYFASHGYQILYVDTGRESLIDQVKMVKQVLHKYEKLIRQSSKTVFYGFHSGAGVALHLSETFPASGLISIEGNESWKNEKMGWPALKKTLNVNKINLPIHRFYSPNKLPEWYFSSPKNTTLEFYQNYSGPTEVTKLDEELGHDELSDLVLWFTWEPKLYQPPTLGRVDEYNRMLGLIRQQIEQWK